MSDKPFLQGNLRLGPTLLNFYADDEEEFDAALRLLNERAGAVASLTAALEAAAVVAGVGLVGQPSAPPRAAEVTPPPASSGSAAPPGPPPECPHGPKVWKTDKSKRTGKIWKAWDCPSGVCDREWVR